MIEIEFKSPKRFIEILIKFQLNNNNFIYRGQSNAGWKLLPSVLRKNCKIPTADGIKKATRFTVREQRNAELSSINLFIKELNKKGFHIPNENTLYRTADYYSLLKFDNAIGRCEEMWPSTDYLSVLALAQHNGLPTRLLDFSLNPLVAAYFAAYDYCQNNHKYKNNNTTHIAVFAVNSKCFHFSLNGLNFLDKEPYELSEERLYFLASAPTFFNDNLKAQQGIFLAYTELGNLKNNPVNPISVEEFLSNQKINSFSCQKEKIYKYTLSVKHAKKLLYYLSKIGIAASDIFPTIDGCVKSVYENSEY